MIHAQWLTEHISAVELKPGVFVVQDHQRGSRFRATREELARYLSQHARSARHIPLGDYLHAVFTRVGLETCLPCAKRQARLNRLVRRWGR